MSETLRDDGTGRDAGLAALYRAAAGEEPPPALDEAVRAAARRAVASRPQRVSSPFARSWRVPLSIAAVVLLTVSLVTVMREEAPEIMLPPDGVDPLEKANQLRAPPAAGAGESATAVSRSLVPHAQRSDSVGLKPLAQAKSSGIGLRDNSVTPDPASRSRTDMAVVGRTESGAPTELSHPRAGLPPDKWLERIEELRRQGRLEEAKMSLAEFRKRYPEYELPASLKEWLEP